MGTRILTHLAKLICNLRWIYDADVIPADGNSLPVIFELIPAGEGTTLKVSETGYRERGWEAAVLEAAYDEHVQGWEFHLPRIAETATAVVANR